MRLQNNVIQNIEKTKVRYRVKKPHPTNKPEDDGALISYTYLESMLWCLHLIFKFLKLKINFESNPFAFSTGSVCTAVPTSRVDS